MWIEIDYTRSRQPDKGVTPLAGVWIEIRIEADGINKIIVTPLAGVWIEIDMLSVDLTPQ